MQAMISGKAPLTPPGSPGSPSSSRLELKLSRYHSLFSDILSEIVTSRNEYFPASAPFHVWKEHLRGEGTMDKVGEAWQTDKTTGQERGRIQARM